MAACTREIQGVALQINRRATARANLQGEVAAGVYQRVCGKRHSAPPGGNVTGASLNPQGALRAGNTGAAEGQRFGGDRDTVEEPNLGTCGEDRAAGRAPQRIRCADQKSARGDIGDPGVGAVSGQGYSSGAGLRDGRGP